MSQDPKNDTKFEDAVAKAVKAALETALPLAVQVAMQTSASVQDSRAAALAAARPSGERCADCKQFLPAGVKQGEHKHKQVAVYPQNRHHGEWFQGLVVNGVRYLSNNGSHLITVPEDLDMNIIANWEENEDQLRAGRRASHNSGDVNNFRPAGSSSSFR